jgi:hypothetical protein
VILPRTRLELVVNQGYEYSIDTLSMEAKFTSVCLSARLLGLRVEVVMGLDNCAAVKMHVLLRS